jgi:hypothetical protein
MNEYVCSGIILQDPESKKEIGSFNNIQEINMTRNTIEKCHDYRGYKPIITKDERVLSFSANTSEINPAILGADFSKTPDQVNILYVKKIQARKHRKKRINKKWLKRYGYKEQSIDFGEWNVKSTDECGEYEFTRKVIDDANSDSTSKRI